MTHFKNEHSTCNCGVLRDRFGEDQMDECRKLVAEYAALVVDLVENTEETTD